MSDKSKQQATYKYQGGVEQEVIAIASVSRVGGRGRVVPDEMARRKEVGGVPLIIQTPCS